MGYKSSNREAASDTVTQGCPLSALLYSLAAEPLAQLIITDRHITGITTPAQRHIKIVQFADDTNLFLKNSEQVDSVITHLDTFCRASGARVNTEKSQIMFCGSVARPPNIWGFEEAQESIKVLGVYIGSDAAAARDKSWEGLLAKLPGQFGLWKMRGLTLRGKVVVTNSLILSKLTHTLAVHDLPNAILAKINNLITTFLWKGKRSSTNTRSLSFLSQIRHSDKDWSTQKTPHHTVRRATWCMQLNAARNAQIST
uniref:Reverse transcriptase domain-containing protein n=1 Tax=Amphiprion percula TaxID=161767 RepID=A0A3P8SYP0_AMPPE